MILTLIGTWLFAAIHLTNTKNNYKFNDHFAVRFIHQELVVEVERNSSRYEVYLQDCRINCALRRGGIFSSR